jgi:hypothetical protein
LVNSTPSGQAAGFEPLVRFGLPWRPNPERGPAGFEAARQRRQRGYKVLQMKAKAPLRALAEYDEAAGRQHTTGQQCGAGGCAQNKTA